MEIDFFKYEGAGNDFIILDGRASGNSGDPELELPSETIRGMCDRHRGVGADGLIVLRGDTEHDFRMQYYNSDGGEANMCGNGGRCIVLFARHLGMGTDKFTFMGRDGVHSARMIDYNGENAIIELGMADVDGYEYGDRTFFLNTGVPHYVEFVDDLDAVDVEEEGRKVRSSERFAAAGGTNVNFVQVLREGQIAVRTYENGVEQETLACGTGAVAASIATHLFAQGDITEFTVTVPGGRLDVSFDSDGDRKFINVKLTGPARRVFTGTVGTGNLPVY